jgi:lipopolysaccharide export system protein LptA
VTGIARSASLLVSLAFALLATAVVAQTPQAEPTRVALGVAPFDTASPEGGALPDVGSALAEALRAHGVQRVIGPAEIGGSSAAALEGEQLRALAERAGVDALVLGRTTRLGGRLSLDVRLRSGRSGDLIGTYVAELAASEPLGPALARLADQVISGAHSLEERAAPAAPDPPTASAAKPAEASDAPAPPSATSGQFGLEALGDDDPLSIRSDALEATDQAGARTLVFQHNVEVRRGDLTLRTEWLEAFYPAGAKQPRDLSAHGDVRVDQGARSARCTQATYTHESQQIVCTGEAELRDGADRIRGDRIVFALRERQVWVEGNVRLDLAPRALPVPDGAGAGRAPDSLALEAPLVIRADRLRAYDRDGRRNILFEGSVELVRSDATLRSERLEALYPERSEQPEQLVATGNVALTQGTREARCERAVYDRALARVECVGDAQLWDGEDRVRGEMIAFDLDARTVVVRGDTRLLLRPAEAAGTALP